MRPAMVSAALISCTVALAIVVQLGMGRTHPEAASVATPWDTMYGDVSTRIVAFRHFAERHAQSSLAWERLAGAHMERARLSGALADLMAAENYLARAFSVAPVGGGPYLARARFHVYVHLLPAAEQDLSVIEAAVLVSDRERAAINDLRAQIDVQSGRTEQARTRWSALVRQRDDPAAWFGLAMLAWKSGDAITGQAHLDRADHAALAAGDTRQRAWLRLQRGLLELDRGRWADALKYYREADILCPGWPLIREHGAEALAELGRTDEAIMIYEELVAQTRDPLFLDALADCYETSGRGDAAATTRAAASIGWNALLEKYPEAGAGHAVAHLLAMGDSDRALPLARRNAELRPYGASFGLLAEVLLASGQHREAREVAEKALAAGWSTADVHAVIEHATDRL